MGGDGTGGSLMADSWSLVTVTFNSARALSRYWTKPRPQGVRWLVVDNGSTDESVELAKQRGADVVCLESNVGFSRANNVGLAQCDSQYVGFVNPDVDVDYSTLEPIAAVADGGRLVAPRLVSADGMPQASGRGLPYLVDKLAHRGLRLPGARLDDYLLKNREDGYAAWVMGAAVCGTRETFETLRGWNESYFLYYEDHDLGLRAWRAGFPVVVLGDAVWEHGWARETLKPSLRPWLREIASGVRFYSHYPEFLLPVRSLARRRHPELLSQLQPATR
jgi:N-acetylglucosaminyl-diphospho-decaprenol L-rhamnosyltransferase